MRFGFKSDIVVIHIIQTMITKLSLISKYFQLSELYLNFPETKFKICQHTVDINYNYCGM